VDENAGKLLGDAFPESCRKASAPLAGCFRGSTR